MARHAPPPQTLMPKATAVWLIDNTTLSFEQIAHFCHMHVLEVKALADGDSLIVGVNPILNGQVTEEDIKAAEADPCHVLVNLSVEKRKKAKEKKYTPLARRHDRPNAIAWFIKYCPSIPDSKIIELIGTTKKTINAIRTRTHPSIAIIKPENPVGLGFCTQDQIDTLLTQYGLPPSAPAS